MDIYCTIVLHDDRVSRDVKTEMAVKSFAVGQSPDSMTVLPQYHKLYLFYDSDNADRKSVV